MTKSTSENNFRTLANCFQRQNLSRFIWLWLKWQYNSLLRTTDSSFFFSTNELNSPTIAKHFATVRNLFSQFQIKAGVQNNKCFLSLHSNLNISHFKLLWFKLFHHRAWRIFDCENVHSEWDQGFFNNIHINENFEI